jgi:hypothetical protein
MRFSLTIFSLLLLHLSSVAAVESPKKFNDPHHHSALLPASALHSNRSLMEVGSLETLYSKAVSTLMKQRASFMCLPDISQLVTFAINGTLPECPTGTCQVPIGPTPFAFSNQFSFCYKTNVLYLKQSVCIQILSTVLKLIGDALEEIPKLGGVSKVWDRILTAAGIDPSNGCFRGPVEVIDFANKRGFGYWHTPPLILVLPPVKASWYLTTKFKFPDTDLYTADFSAYLLLDGPGFKVNVTVIVAKVKFGAQPLEFKLLSEYKPPDYDIDIDFF